ncbi:hypothetical protein FA13DRAFT_1643470 [Coprinellus micaceus]|uniref:CHAT domain-containing protein n=1 Tax=Coprinellus micaceus TaxID=71717 RepID=A0A4Y7SHT6_COPMI|nr:hypothetical protein FA13DRAFT_1643470 [Coprinellus micaceus]
MFALHCAPELDNFDTSEIIWACKSAIETSPDDDGWRSLLGLAYHMRFSQTRDLSDLDRAISAGHLGLKQTPRSRQRTRSRACLITEMLNARFEATACPHDLENAIAAQQGTRALKILPEGHPALPILFNSLGTWFLEQSRVEEDRANIDAAVLYSYTAMGLAPDGHPALSTGLRIITLTFASRFSVTQDPAILPEALAASRKLLGITAGESLNLPAIRFALGVFQENLSLTSGKPFTHSISDAIFHFKAGALCSPGRQIERLEASRAWAQLSNRVYPRSLDTLHAFDVTLELVAGRDRHQQMFRGNYSHLRELSKLPVQAAAAACRMGSPERAIEWLERGRCLVWNHISHLQESLAQTGEHTLSPHNIAQRHTSGFNASKLRFDSFVRKMASLEDGSWDGGAVMLREILPFYGPPAWSTVLENLPEQGPVVVINLYEDRCDALALLAGLNEPLHIPLPCFSVEKAIKYRSELKVQLNLRGLRAKGGEKELGRETTERGAGPYRRKGAESDKNVVRRILRCLWIEVVKPILDVLAISVNPTSGGTLPRVWWCPTGPLSFLPIHAAGIYGSFDCESTHDYVVSSYTPSVTSLIDRMKDISSIDTPRSGLFLTNQPQVPHQVRIPGTTTEVELIYEKGMKEGIRVHKIEGSEITPTDCLHYMETYSAIHLACHASQNSTVPMKSHFRFHNGSLDLVTIMKRDLKHADLAFLSACETSAGDESLSEEAIHLAAGMLAAGYRRVVATMWVIQDRHAPGVANDFYDYLWRGGDGSASGGRAFDGRASAYALHHAIQRLRDRLGNSDCDLLAWIPYVHFGY